jgi:hypothetical protein
VFAESEKAASSKLLPPLSIELPDSSKQSGGVVRPVIYSASWCLPCKPYRKECGEAFDDIDSQWVDIDVGPVPPDVAKLMATLNESNQGNIPLTTFIDVDGKLRWHVGPLTKQSLKAMIARSNPPVMREAPHSNAVGSKRGQLAPSAGTIRGRERIIAALDFIRSRVGEGVPMRFEWDRTGAQALPLLHGAAWTPLAIYGKSGEFRLSATGAINLPVADVSLGYRFATDGKLRLRGETEIDASVLDWTKGDVASAGDSKAVGVDPMTILTVVSVLNGIWQALHPTADLTLGGNIACEAVLNGDNLAVKFSQAPSVRVVAWFTFNLGIESVDISSERVRVGFSGSRWIKERTLEVR